MQRLVNAGEAPSSSVADFEDGDRGGPRAASSDRVRLALLLAVFGLRLLGPKVALAQQPVNKPMVGRRVVQRTNDLTLRIENRIVDRARALHFYRVEQTNGPWLWVRA
jgi:hypothetical protein